MPTAEGQYVDLQGRGVRLHYRDWGGEGPVVLLLHGLSSNSRIWDFTAPLLRTRHRVIALDLRGHGLSDVPEDGYGFDEVTADVVAFLDLVGLESVTVVGHSWGATVALVLAVDHPHRVDSVALIDGGIIEIARFSDWETAEREMTPPEIPGVPVDTFLGFARKWPHIQGLWTDELGEMILSNFDVREGRVYRRLDIPRHMKIARSIYDSRPSEIMPRVTCAALIVVATNTPRNDAERRWQGFRQDGIALARQAMPDATVIVMQDSIHDLPVQRPAELAKTILDWRARRG